MQFKEAVKILGIEEYAEAIWNSNSHGELMHIQQYLELAELAKKEDLSWFADVFKDIIKQANEKWKRPESVYQHIIEIIIQQK